MLPVLSIEQIRQADQYTIQHEPIASINLMERAAQACTNWLLKRLDKRQRVVVFAGPGNNGGDGLAIARQLWGSGYHRVEIVLPQISASLSEDCAVNLKALEQLDGVMIHMPEQDKECPLISSDDLVIDALFGSGLSRPAEGLAADCIRMMNASGAVITAIDIPSGLFADKPNDLEKDPVISADYTLSLQFLKHSFVFAENELFVGQVEILPIGLHPAFIQQAPAAARLTTKESMQSLIKPRLKHAHKGHFGHALLIAGSLGMTGAARLSAYAALRTGLGLLTVHLPKHATSMMQIAVPEAMLSVDEHDECFSVLPKGLESYNAVGVGPGLGTSDESTKALKFLIQEARVPLVLDADALNILAENPTYMAFLPEESILTPHPGEFARLVGNCGNGFERTEKQRELARRYQVYVVLKGAYTSIATPDGDLFYNTSGNPGMATAGSGDVLTGMILSLLAQRYTPLEATLLGVYLHGKAGDLALESESQQSLLASDIIGSIGRAYKDML